MEMDRLAEASRRGLLRRVLSALSAIAAIAAMAGLGWALIDPRGGGAMVAFCGFVTYLVARALRWSL